MRARTGSAGYAHLDATKPPDWHGLVVWDVLLNAVATGLFLVTALAELAAPAVAAPVVPWVYPLCLAVLLADLLCLVLDLGDPLRFHHMLRVFKPSSPMSLGTWCLTAFSLPLTAVVGLDLLRAVGVGIGDGVRTVALVAALPFAFGSAAYKGVLFSTTVQPGWRDARWLGAYQISGAFAIGAVVLLGLSAGVTGDTGLPLRTLAVMLLAVHGIASAAVAGELRPAAVERSPPGRIAGTVTVVGGSLLAPLLLLAVSAHPAAVLSAAALVLAGGYFARRQIVLLPHRPKNLTSGGPT